MPRTWLSIEGDEKFKAFLDTRPDVALHAIASALYIEAEVIMSKSKRIVPVDTGTLRGSGHTQEPEVHGTKVSVTMGYGGAASDYALIQHEGYFVHTGNQRRKYLERPTLEAQKGLDQRIARRIARRLEAPTVWRTPDAPR